MSSGLPVIATPAGGVADHLRHDKNGIAVPPHDVDATADAIVALTLDDGIVDVSRLGHADGHEA